MDIEDSQFDADVDAIDAKVDDVGAKVDDVGATIDVDERFEAEYCDKDDEEAELAGLLLIVLQTLDSSDSGLQLLSVLVSMPLSGLPPAVSLVSASCSSAALAMSVSVVDEVSSGCLLPGEFGGGLSGGTPPLLLLPWSGKHKCLHVVICVKCAM